MKSSATDEGFAAAFKIYSEGGYSKSVATIELSAPLTMDRAKSTAVSQGIISGKFYKAASAGDTIIKVQYISTGCHVGGLSTPETDGCKCCHGAPLDYVCCVPSNSCHLLYYRSRRCWGHCDWNHHFCLHWIHCFRGYIQWSYHPRFQY